MSEQLRKTIYLIILIIGCCIYAIPNLYGELPGIQVQSVQGPLPANTATTLTKSLTDNSIKPMQIITKKNQVTLLFTNTELQNKAQAFLRTHNPELKTSLNLFPQAPEWYSKIGAKPMKLGLDLRGGVHFLLNVNVEGLLSARHQSDQSNMLDELRASALHQENIASDQDMIKITFATPETRNAAYTLIAKNFRDYDIVKIEDNQLLATTKPASISRTIDYAVDQAMTILRNRVNELGVSEAVVHRQGGRNISVELPGIQDTSHAKELLGKTATLAFHLVSDENASADSNLPAPAGSKWFYDSKGRPILLNKQIILRGDSITYASSVLEQGLPAVSINLGGGGQTLFHHTTNQNIGKNLAIVYIETEVKQIKGSTGKMTNKLINHEKVISNARINSGLGNSFVITGLDSQEYAQNLALLLRSGALAAPVNIVQELTVGPSLGLANINMGIKSMAIGSIFVILFMMLYYRLFGLIANLALTLNVIIIIAMLSIIGATLTLPGIAGIVLTIGMAVDANVLINERIREELRAGMSNLASIRAGYDRAFATIVDANLTTLIVALVLFMLGSGAVKGFAVTLTIGLVASMITAIFFTRILVESLYRWKPNLAVSIGITINKPSS